MYMRHMYYNLLCVDIITEPTSQKSWTEQAHTDFSNIPNPSYVKH